MKKKRKKKTTSRCFPLPCLQLYFTKATFVSVRSPGSVPDVPNGNENKVGMQGCLKFAVRLFGKEGWHAVPDELHLRTFIRQLTDNVLIHWNTVQVGDRLYICVPNEVSRDSFVALLDYAEEVLEVSRVIVCLDCNSQNFRDLAKSFRFMGFEHVAVDHPTVAFQQSKDNSISVPNGFHFLGCDLD